MCCVLIRRVDNVHPYFFLTILLANSAKICPSHGLTVNDTTRPWIRIIDCSKPKPTSVGFRKSITLVVVTQLPKLSCVYIWLWSITKYYDKRRFTKLSEITQYNGHFAVQGHSRSPILVQIESSYI